MNPDSAPAFDPNALKQAAVFKQGPMVVSDTASLVNIAKYLYAKTVDFAYFVEVYHTVPILSATLHSN